MEKEPTVIFDTDGRKTIKLYSYAVLLTEKDGSGVMAIRVNGAQRKTDVYTTIVDTYPQWNIKAIHKLYDEDFEA